MKIEEIISNNKGKFEEEPLNDLWTKIEEKLPKEPKIHFWTNKNILRIAAGIMICVSFGIGLGKMIYQNDDFRTELSIQNPAFASFNQEISKKQNKLEKLIDTNPSLEKEFNNSLKSLQNDFKKLEKELKTNPNHDQLIEAMIQNLQWQIELLNQQTEIAENVIQNNIM